ncbi:LOG family protein [Ectobacillus funiculus]|uniref:Cytokinin riboside 5'-monophosphate phosphoribohydrolase n=1 Tax=Ectobacillus funiculus TaxID=137993 RepID=A0ABV5WLN1_9BACI
MLKKICVFCGSSFGKNGKYIDDVRLLGKTLAACDIELIYGGGNVGLMGELARSVLEQGGKVTGIIPKKIYENVNHVELTNLIVVEHMHDRKAKMYEMADAFIALPGGIGTLEELAEVMTWQQIGYHSKPVALFNMHGYYDGFMQLLSNMEEEGFLKKQYIENLVINDEPVSLLEQLGEKEISKMNKWQMNE